LSEISALFVKKPAVKHSRLVGIGRGFALPRKSDGDIFKSPEETKGPYPGGKTKKRKKRKSNTPQPHPINRA
jgi:hypothetical protein